MINLWYALDRKIRDTLDHGTILGGMLAILAVSGCAVAILYAFLFILFYGTYLLLGALIIFVLCIMGIYLPSVKESLSTELMLTAVLVGCGCGIIGTLGTVIILKS